MGNQSKHPLITKAIGVFLTIIVTAVITTIWNNYNARAKPYAELISVDFSRPPTDEKIGIYPTTEIMNLQIDSGISLHNFANLHTIYAWEDLIKMVNQNATILPLAISTIKQIISDLNTLALDTEDRIRSARVSLLKKFGGVPFGTLQSFTMQILERKGYLNQIRTEKKYEKYKKHPEDWKSPTQGLVYYSNNRYFKLWELTPENACGQDKLFTQNVFRRMWIYMDKDFMIKVFDDALSDLEQTLPITQQLASAMEELLDKEYPKRIHCLVALSNIGDKAAIFKGNALFSIKKADKDIRLWLSAYDNKKPSDAFSVNGQSSMLVDFYSVESIDKFESDSFPNLRRNYKDKILRCDISLYRLSEDLGYNELKPKNDRIFGPN